MCLTSRAKKDTEVFWSHLASTSPIVDVSHHVLGILGSYNRSPLWRRTKLTIM